MIKLFYKAMVFMTSYELAIARSTSGNQRWIRETASSLLYWEQELIKEELKWKLMNM